MRIAYYSETDSMYIELSEKKSVSSEEVSPGVVLDYDTEGNLVGIDIDNAGKKFSLEKLILSKIPTDEHLIAA